MEIIMKYKLKNMIKPLSHYFLLTSAVMLSGCSTLDENEMSKHPSDENILNGSVAIQPQTELVLNFHTHQMIADFTERLAYGLMKKNREILWNGNVAIASFVNLDDTLKQGNPLGNLISENLLGDMQTYGVPVLDVHMKGFLNIDDTGDYIFSRDSDEIIYNENIKYVLSGVMIRVERGVKVNSRIMELNTQKIISSSSVLIPNYLIDMM